MQLENNDTLLIESLPLEIFDNIIKRLSNGQAHLRNVKEAEGKYPAFTYITNSERYHGCYHDLLSLSSTSRSMRMKLGGVLFRSISLIRENQIDSLLSTPKTRQLYSDKKTYHREFMKELIGGNIEECSKSELARSSFKTHIIGDRSFKCYYEEKLCMCNFVTYLECDNEVLNSSELSMFPNISELRILDECATIYDTEIQCDVELPKLKSLAVHAQTLQTSNVLLKSLHNLRRLDLFLLFSDIASVDGLQRILVHLSQHNLALEEICLFLEQPYNLRYHDTVHLLKKVVSAPLLQKLTIRVKRRKSSLQLTQGEHQLYKESFSDEILKAFQKVEQLVIDFSLLDQIMLDPVIELLTHNSIGGKKQVTIVDRAILSPKMTVRQKEVLGAIVRTCGFANLSFYYGESLEESHLHVLNIVTDFIRWIVDPISTHGQVYCGLELVSIEKCWSITDESFIREGLKNCITEGKAKPDINRFKVWGRSALNSPRFRRREIFDLSYHRLSQYNVTMEGGYYVGTSNIPTDSVTIVTSQATGLKSEENHFWSAEASLCDFEQYCMHQRRSLLFG